MSCSGGVCPVGPNGGEVVSLVRSAFPDIFRVLTGHVCLFWRNVGSSPLPFFELHCSVQLELSM